MKLNVYSIYDKASNLYSEPYIAINDDVAKRKFNIILSGSPDLMIKDLQLTYVGSFANDSGCFSDTGELVPIVIAYGEDFLAMRGDKNVKA